MSHLRKRGSFRVAGGPTESTDRLFQVAGVGGAANSLLLSLDTVPHVPAVRIQAVQASDIDNARPDVPLSSEVCGRAGCWL